jgi:hypothetical protein
MTHALEATLVTTERPGLSRPGAHGDGALRFDTQTGNLVPTPKDPKANERECLGGHG